MLDVLEIAQILKAERVAVSKANGPDGRNARMTDDESFPLPRCGGQSEQMTHKDAVRTSVCDECDLLAWFFDVPHRQFALDPVDSSLGEEVGRSSMDSRNEITNRLSTFQPVPTIG